MPARAAAIEAECATVRRAGATYDESVQMTTEIAAREGWLVVSDTSWPGYTEVPRLVMQGYRLMVDEALDQIGAAPTHVFIQAGVGGIAAAVAVQLRARLQTPYPCLVIIEPDKAACLLVSAERGTATALNGSLDTVDGMSGVR